MSSEAGTLTTERGAGRGGPRSGRGAGTGQVPRRRRTGRPEPGRVVGRVLVWSFVAFNVLIFLFLITSSVKSTPDIFDAPWGLPTSLHLENWSNAWNESGFARATVNTVALAVAGSVSTLVVSAPAAYVLSRVRHRSAGPLSLFFALGLGIPAQVTVIPLFEMMSNVGLVNSLFGLYVLYTATHVPFTVFLLTGFMRSLPGEIEEAAAIDGASALRSFAQVMLPLARSGLVTVLILNAISMWNETLLGIVFLQSVDKYTLSLAVLNFLSSMQFSGADYGGLFAGVCILVLPMLLLYVWLGRRIVEGITLGAGK
ncbi:carbohydrate ABC transporter permease [Jiangella asiatica]|uniref:carbohydrate ABC transporter permease n=1 Tax=Jiangella asiatica TaxID=2530372 RepID=UPI0013A5D6F5|nr:carbohydrate ABC transporter permease [Jiangella asiatica]